MAFIFDIEGTDGCGKQTQSLMLVEKLKELGYDAFRQDFPNYNSISSGPVQMILNGDFGDSVNSLTPYQVSSLYAVDRLCTFQVIGNRLNGDAVLILDRYTNSNVIHNASKFDDTKKRNSCINWIYKLEYDTLGLPRPDIVFFLDMPIEISMSFADARAAKKNAKKDVFENDKEYQIKTYRRSKRIAKKLGWTIISCEKDGAPRPIEEINKEILSKVLEKIKGN